MKPIIKVCGMRDADNIRAVEALGADWMGFIFWPGSKRYVAEPPTYLPLKAKRVGVFVDATINDILQHVAGYRLDAIQLHGNESPDFLRALRTALHAPHDSCSCPVCSGRTALASHHASHVAGGSPAYICLIKAFSIATPRDLAATEAYAGLADYFLFDTKAAPVPDAFTSGSPMAKAAPVPDGSPSGSPVAKVAAPSLPGGTGCQFDWSILSAYHGNTPFLLSGGIGANDAQRLRALRALDGFPIEQCVGIDLNSRFEVAPALKDINKLKEFIKELSI
ncbi:phosphoribosylanthranilate isomerase [Prevotellaceae bacterium MN60]|nr:phosphoribosylanthranilate isomerase [Prevotellaceae bacterium MN60]